MEYEIMLNTCKVISKSNTPLPQKKVSFHQWNHNKNKNNDDDAVFNVWTAVVLGICLQTFPLVDVGPWVLFPAQNVIEFYEKCKSVQKALQKFSQVIFALVCNTLF